MVNIKTFLVASALLFSVFLASCSTTVNLKARSDLSADMDLALDIGAYFAEAVESISVNSGRGTGLSSEAVEESFQGGDFRNIKAVVPNKQEVIVTGRLAAPQEHTVDVNGIKSQSFIKCTKNSLTFTLSAKAIQSLYAAMNDESRSYADLLMAPVFTGDRMTTSEYRDLLSAVYGRELAEETEKARIKITLEPPSGKRISSSSQEYKLRQSSSAVTFSVPAFEILNLTDEKSFKIEF